ncbi:MAG: VWA domain-containing protein [Planctomycetota bacterium]
MTTVIMGFGALAIDVGMLYQTKAELQAAADSAALAAAAQLAGEGDLDPEELARLAAQEYALKHEVLGAQIHLDMYNDVEVGKAVYNPATQKFEFQPSAYNMDAVRVTTRRTADSANGSVPLMFANVLGFSEKDMWARASAVLIPRDIAVVIDLSNSMCYDSELRYWNRSDGGYSNLRDIWCALNGPEPSHPYIPGSELETEYASDTGPTFGAMTVWGDPLIPGSYDPTSDPGLWYIKKYYNCSAPAAHSSLVSRGYCDSEISALLSGSQDGNYSGQWRNRAGVILGLATWHSGHTGGCDPPGGNGNNLVGDSETTWEPTPEFALNWNWKTFVDYVRNTNPSQFRYRYGLKTFTDFLMENRPESYATDGLWGTPEQPLRATKDAVQTMVDVITALDSLDHLSLEIFATVARHQVNLTEDLQSVANTLYQRQSGHWDRCTCIGGGLQKAIDELKCSRARSASAKVIVLMSDGVANIDENGNSSTQGARDYALAMAEQAADEGFRIYAVSVGYNVDRDLMQAIAAEAGGQEFYAVGSPEEYTEQLEMIFRTLGGKRPVALIE